MEEPHPSAPSSSGRRRVKKRIRIQSKKKKKPFTMGRIFKLKNRTADMLALLLLVIFMMTVFAMVVYRGPSDKQRTKKKLIRQVSYLQAPAITPALSAAVYAAPLG